MLSTQENSMRTFHRDESMPASWTALSIIIPPRYHKGVYNIVLEELYEAYARAAAGRRGPLGRFLIRVRFCVKAWVATLDVLRAIAVDRVIHGPIDDLAEAEQPDPDAKRQLAPHGW